MLYQNNICDNTTCSTSLEQCSICFDNINYQDLFTTQCGHIFHYSCIHSWVIRNNNCPICRKQYIIGSEKLTSNSNSNSNSTSTSNSNNIDNLFNTIYQTQEEIFNTIEQFGVPRDYFQNEEPTGYVSNHPYVEPSFQQFISNFRDFDISTTALDGYGNNNNSLSQNNQNNNFDNINININNNNNNINNININTSQYSTSNANININITYV